MKFKNETPYPTIGEFLLVFFNISGLWDFLDSNNDNEVKNIQKKLQRFAAEESLLSKSEIITLLRASIDKAVHNSQLSCILVASITNFILLCTRDIFSESTWLPRKETCEWYLHGRVSAHFVEIIHRACILYRHENNETNNIFFPEQDFWFLPSQKEDGTWELPKQKTIRWWLNINNYSSAEDLEKDANGKITAATIRNWMKQDTIPSISTLRYYENAPVKDCFEKENLKNSFTVCMIISRTVQKFFDIVINNFGKNHAIIFLEEFKLLYVAFQDNEKIEMMRLLSPIKESSFEKWGQAESYFYDRVNLSKGKSQFNSNGKTFFELELEQRKKYQFQKLPKHLYNFICLSEEIRKLTSPYKVPSLRLAKERIAKMRRVQNESFNLNHYLPFFEARIAVYEKKFDIALELYVQAFQIGRYKAGELIKYICIETMGLLCFLHTIDCDEKKKRGSLWKTAKYIRDWTILNSICAEIADEDDRAYLEKGRRFFEEVFGKHLSPEKVKFTRFGSNDAIFNPKITPKKSSWKPNFRHPSKLDRDSYFRDNSQLMTAILNHKEKWALRLIEDGANLNFINTTNDNVFTYTLTQKSWPQRFYVAEKILDGDILLETLQTPTKRFKSNAMSLVLENRSPLLLKKLLKKGYDFNKRIPTLNGMTTPLYYAVQCLFDLRVDLEDPQTQLQMLHSADYYNHPRPYFGKRSQELMNGLIEYYNEKKGDPNDVFEIIKILIVAGSTVDAINLNGHTAMTLATEGRFTNIVEYLLLSGANPNHRIENRATALNLAVYNDDIATAKSLINNGAYCDNVRNDGLFLLDECRSEFMRQLIVNGISNGSVSLNVNLDM